MGNSKKGTFGYINIRKKTQLMKSIAAFFTSFLIFIVGYMLNNNSKQNIFTFISVLAILPSAKILISYIILFPFHSVSREEYDKMNTKLNTYDDWYTDLVFTSSEKVMNLSFLVLQGNQLLGLSQYKKADDKCIQQYLQRMMDGRNLPIKVNIEKDFQKYLKHIERNTEHLVSKEDREELHNTIMSILV